MSGQLALCSSMMTFFTLSCAQRIYYLDPRTDDTDRKYDQLGSNQSNARLTQEPEVLPDEHRLIDRVFTNYDNSVRPVFNAADNVKVTFGFTLIQIMDMDEKNQLLITNAWLEHIWFDERINWDPTNYNGLKVLRIPASRLWLPDIVLYNNADDYTNGYMLTNAMVNSTGEIFWSPPVRLRSSCKVDITFFPFDIQICELKFGSWTYDKEQVDVVNKSSEVEISNYVTNGEWLLIKYQVMRRETVYPIQESVVYPDVTIILTIKRRILYYVLNIIFPCVWLSILVLFGFCLPPDEGEKVTLGITVLLSYSVFMLLVAENMPSTSEFVPLIGMYLLVSMSVTCLSIMLTVLVLKLYHCSPHQPPVPNWVRKWILGKIGSAIFCSFPTSNNKQKFGPVLGHGQCKAKHDLVRNSIRITNNRVNRPSSEREKHTKITMHEVSNARQWGLYSRRSHHIVPVEEANQVKTESEQKDTVVEKPQSEVDELLTYLKVLVAKCDAEVIQGDVASDWKHVALVVDRLLFLFFALITLCATILILVLLPVFRPEDKRAV